MTGAALLLLSLVGLAAGGALGANALLLRRGIDWLLAAVVLVFVEATLLTIGIGAVLRTYERWAILLGVAAWAAAAWLVGRGRGASWDGAQAARVSAVRTLRGLAWWQWALVVLAGLALAWRTLLAVVLPPFGFDAIVYHLTIVADWVQGGRVEANHYVTCCSHYPSGVEALFAWPALFMDDDLLVDTPQIALAVLAALAVAGLGRWVGLTPGSAVTAGALVAVTPIVLTQANTSYNDVAVAAFLLAALYFVVRLLDATCFRFARGEERIPSLAAALLAGLSTGLVLGAKTSGIVISVVLATLVGAHLVDAGIRQRALRRRLLGIAAAFVSTTLAVGVWWYARNWVETGNPLWPFDVSLGDRTVFAGPETMEEYLTVPPEGGSWPFQIARSWYHDLAFWLERDYSYEERSGGLGPLWGWLGWGGVVVLAWHALRRRHDVLVNALLPLLLIFVLLPYKWWSRFTIFLPAVGVLGILLLLDRLRPGWRRTALVSAVLVLAVAGVVRATWTLDPAARGSKLKATDVLELAAHPLRDRTVGTLFFPEYAFLPRLPSAASVAVEKEAPSIRFPYPFFGRGLDRTVTLLRPGDERRLAAILEGSDVEFVAVEARGAFDRRLAARPAAWDRIFDEHGVRVYRRVGS